jgi:type IX secretion system PorP/SprF family membrane protein
MLRKLLVVVFLVLGLADSIYAQQDPMYTQYAFNGLAINPAYAGSRNNVLNATALYRRQWIGIEGAPETQTLAFDMPVAEKRVGLGLQFFNDKIGITKTTGAYASYAYRIITETGKLAFGLQAGVTNFKADYASVPLNTGSPPDVAFSQNVNKFLPNFGAGIYYNTSRFYAGASAPHLLNNSLSNNTADVTNSFSREVVHWFITSGYVFDLGEDLKLKSSMLFKGVKGAPVQMDVGANLWVKDAVSFGLSYRSLADISATIEASLSWQIQVGYSYDRSMSRLSKYNSGSHELMLRYQFSFDKDAYYEPKCYF